MGEQKGRLSVFDIFRQKAEPADDPTGWLRDEKTLSEVVVTSSKKDQQAKPGFFKSILGGINDFLGKIKVPTIKTGTDNSTNWFIGITVVVVLAFVFLNKRYNR
jgi:hypothetical protein